jgi:hypothetical protein
VEKGFRDTAVLEALKDQDTSRTAGLVCYLALSGAITVEGIRQ